MQNLSPQEVQAYKKAFKFFDSDNSGAISVTELGHAMGRLGYNLNTNQIQTILNAVDTNHNSQIDFSEFLEFIKKAKG